MLIMRSNYRSIFGMNCTRCGDLLIAPELSEYADKHHVLHSWSCTNCGYQFDTTAFLPPAEFMNDAATTKGFLPSLLVG